MDKFIKLTDKHLDLLEIDGINYNHIILLAIIESLSGKKVNNIKRDYCWASNRYLAEKMHTSERTVRRLLSKLYEEKLISKNFNLNDDGRISRTIILGGQ